MEDRRDVTNEANGRETDQGRKEGKGERGEAIGW